MLLFPALKVFHFTSLWSKRTYLIRKITGSWELEEDNCLGAGSSPKEAGNTLAYTKDSESLSRVTWEVLKGEFIDVCKMLFFPFFFFSSILRVKRPIKQEKCEEFPCPVWWGQPLATAQHGRKPAWSLSTDEIYICIESVVSFLNNFNLVILYLRK